MKQTLKIMLLFGLLGCTNDKLIRKEISDDSVNIKWYFSSQITNNSPDFITVKKGNSAITIYEAVDVVTDVRLSKKKIIIKLFEPHRGIIYTKKMPKNVFGYEIVVDTNSTYEEYLKIPDGHKK